jgi:hypothetical protein
METRHAPKNKKYIFINVKITRIYRNQQIPVPVPDTYYKDFAAAITAKSGTDVIPE